VTDDFAGAAVVEDLIGRLGAVVTDSSDDRLDQ